ncbi:hypothetical protein [Ornithinimicrobium pratense]|uniref:Uncharacterized protein n=1 Tax=Ornithinimicrobium pratense TaxID=2593973 RepID=A0A5J6V3I7_9MICO|nr:hypothetical protein [Ornithinimicrobium pratense]QFG68439.1 hypothetical protein FY030_06675 [Ornithinimicrobium pratense]
MAASGQDQDERGQTPDPDAGGAGVQPQTEQRGPVPLGAASVPQPGQLQQPEGREQKSDDGLARAPGHEHADRDQAGGERGDGQRPTAAEVEEGREVGQEVVVWPATHHVEEGE